MAQRKKVKDTKGHFIPNLWIDTASGVYYVRKEKLGKTPLDKSLGDVSLSLAKRLKDQAIAEWLGDDRPGAKKGAKLHKFSTYWNEVYIPAKEKSVSARSVKTYKVCYATHLESFFGDCFIEHIDRKLWDDFLNQAQPEAILFNAHKGLMNCLKHACDISGIIPAVPSLPLPKERKQKLVANKPAVGHVYERRDVVMAARNAGQGSNLRLAILMGYKMGMRIGETVSVRLSKGTKKGEYNYAEFRSDGVVLHLNEVKNKKPRVCYCDPIVAAMLRNRRAKKESVWAMPQIRNKLKHWSTNSLDNCWQELKVDQGLEYRFHDLRHTMLTWKFREEGSKAKMALICNYVGMSLKTAEKVYLHLTEQDTRVVVQKVGAQSV